MNDDVTATNKVLARNFLDLCFAGDVEAALALTIPDFSWWVLGDPARLRVSGLRWGPRVERLLRALPAGMRHRFLAVTAEDDRVAVEAEAEGLWTADTVYRNSYHFLLRIDRGRIASVREYMDTLAVARLAGPADQTD